MEINYYLNNIEENKVVLILNSTYNKKQEISSGTVKDYLLSVSTEQRIIKVFKMLGIHGNVLRKDNNTLSNLERVLIIIAYQLLQNRFLIINYLDALLNYKEKKYLKQLLKKLAHEYNIKTIIFTNNLKFCFNLVDKIMIVDNIEVKKILSNDFYNEEIYKYIDIPDIVSFVMDAKRRGIKLDNYLQKSELLKGIYRL